jgi:hypothetical protein
MCDRANVVFTSEIAGNADIFRVPAYPIEAGPVDVLTDGEQLTRSASTDAFPQNASSQANVDVINVVSFPGG